MTPQTVLITGATAGLGRHAALTLARRGHKVIAAGRRQDALDALLAEAAGLDLHALRLDVTDPASIDAAVGFVDGLTAGRGLDVLVNNAGYGQLGAVLDVDDALVRRQYETNVFGLLAMTRAFAPAMARRGRGRIVNLSSIGGLFTLPLFGVYNSTKYAVESLSDALRRELAPCGVRVSLVEPGTIRTEFGDHARASVTRGQGPWADVYDAAEARYAVAERMAPDPAPISAVLVHAVEARRPRARYSKPVRDRWMIALFNALPTRLTDALMRRLFGLDRVVPSRLGAVAEAT